MSLEEYGKKAIAVAPWGGQGGIHWDDGVYSTVRQIVIAHGWGIDSIRIEYDFKGASIWSEVHGGNGGTAIDKIKLNHPDEYLTSINGCYGSLNQRGAVIIRSLTLETNKRTYGPYGIEQGTRFSLPKTQGKIVGFHGYCGWYLDAIGVHIQPLHQSQTYSNSIVQYSQSYNANVTDANGYSFVQGSIGKNYDLVIALRYKDDQNNDSNSSPGFNNILSRQASTNSKELISNSSPPETKPKMHSAAASALPSIERVSSKGISGVMTYGPWGGSGGTMFDDGIYDGVRQVNVSRNVGIVYIRVCYDKNGQPVWGSKNGGTGGFKTDKIVLEYPSEILTHITGYYGPTMIMGPNIIKSVTFHTTKGKYGPFGEEQGQSFSTNLREGMIVGFHGKKGMFVDALGVHVEEKKILPAATVPSKISEKTVPSKISEKNAISKISEKNVPSNQQPSISEAGNPNWTFKLKRGLTEEGVQRVVKDPSPSGPGPWGGDGGKPWDDGVFTGIKQIILTRSDAICAIEIEYDRNGQSVWSVKHGGNGGQTTHPIKLEYPHEVLTRISGYYGPISKAEWTSVIKSLTFYTTRKRYGPYGEEIGTYFTSTTTEGKVVGFHGRSGMYLDAIGVHLQHWFGNQKTSKPSSLKKFFF